MGGFFSRTVYVESPNFSGIGERLEWCIKYHGRGFFGTIIPIIYGSIAGKFNQPKINVVVIMNVMLICVFLQPVSLPVVGMLPIFLIPMSSILNTVTVCRMYFSADICLIFIGGLMSFLLNNLGLDRRLIIQILTLGKNYKPNQLLFKACIAAFFTSFWGNHLYATATMYEFLEPIFSSFQIPAPKPKDNKKKGDGQMEEYNYLKFQHIINEALLVSANLGHLNMIHTSWVLILMRTLYKRSLAEGSQDDLFNYMQYMMFSLVFTFTALCITIIYFSIALMVVNSNRKPMSVVNMNMMTTKFQETIKNELPPMRKYQKVRNTIAIFYLLAAYAFFLTRYTPWFSWSIAFRTKNVISDATVGAGFIMIFSAFPRAFGFLKIFKAKKRAEINLKPESGLLFWRFVDKAVNYGYIYVLGGASVMVTSFQKTGLAYDLSESLRGTINSCTWIGFAFIVSGGTVVCCNIASPIPMLACIYPYILGMITGPKRPEAIDGKAHLVALISALSGSFNYLTPFRNTLSFHRNHLTRTKVKHVWLHAFIMSILHAILLVIFASFLGPVIWFQKKTIRAPRIY